MENTIHKSKYITDSQQLAKSGWQKKIITFAISLALLGGCGEQKEKNKEKYLPFPKDTLEYWDKDTTFFTQNYKPQREKLDDGIEIIRDAGLIFYVATKKDIKQKKVSTGKKKNQKKETMVECFDFKGIRKNLSKYPEFAYLLRDEYDNKTKGFNILEKDVIDGIKKYGNFYLPIPLDSKIRNISVENFINYTYEAIQEMKTHHIYGEKINKLLSYISEDDLIVSLVAFARSETAEDYVTFQDNIGSVELHRWEDRYKSFSFGYFHILMEKNKDGSDGPGLRARKKLGLTEGQAYHPKNAVKLCLAYWIEKKGNELESYFPFNEKNIPNVARSYNGGNYQKNEYDIKLKKNYDFVNKKLKNGKIKK